MAGGLDPAGELYLSDPDAGGGGAGDPHGGAGAPRLRQGAAVRLLCLYRRLYPGGGAGGQLR